MPPTTEPIAAPAAAKKHTLPALPQRGIEILRQLMDQPGWTKSIEEIIRGGQLLADVIPQLEDRPVEPVDNMTAATIADYRKVVKAWNEHKLPAWEITDKQRDTIRACIKFCAEKGAVPATPTFVPVLLAFGFGE